MILNQRFPQKNLQLLKLWILHVRRKNWKPNWNSRLCSDHFTEEDYKCKPGAKRRRLKEDAVPSQFSFNKHKEEPRRKLLRGGNEDTLQKEYHCQHGSKPRKGAISHKKITNCHSKLSITTKQPLKKSLDEYIKTHPCQVNIHFAHNHDLATPIILKDMVPDTTRGSTPDSIQTTFDNLFEKNGFTSSALQAYKLELLKQGDDYFEVSSDGCVASCLSEFDSNSEEPDTQQCVDKLKLVFDNLGEKLIKNPQVFAEPIEKFVENFQECKTDSEIVSALCNFGRYNVFSKKQKEKNLQASNTIGLQSNTISPSVIRIMNRAVNSDGKLLQQNNNVKEEQRFFS